MCGEEAGGSPRLPPSLQPQVGHRGHVPGSPGLENRHMGCVVQPRGPCPAWRSPRQAGRCVLGVSSPFSGQACWLPAVGPVPSSLTTRETGDAQVLDHSQPWKPHGKRAEQILGCERAQLSPFAKVSPNKGHHETRSPCNKGHLTQQPALICGSSSFKFLLSLLCSAPSAALGAPPQPCLSPKKDTFCDISVTPATPKRGLCVKALWGASSSPPLPGPKREQTP